MAANEATAFIDRVSPWLAAVGSPPTLDQAAAALDARIKEVRDFRAAAPFGRVSFQPSKPVAAGDLTFGVPNAILGAMERLPPGFRFLVLLDEYENFSPSQQRILNTLIKFPQGERHVFGWA